MSQPDPDVDFKIRQLINPCLREIHETTGAIMSMGDIAVYVGQPMQDAMEELANFIQEKQKTATANLVTALAESVKLQSHYAMLLNGWDGGERLQFPTTQDWINRLIAVGTIQPKAKP